MRLPQTPTLKPQPCYQPLIPFGDRRRPNLWAQWRRRKTHTKEREPTANSLPHLQRKDRWNMYTNLPTCVHASSIRIAACWSLPACPFVCVPKSPLTAIWFVFILSVNINLITFVTFYESSTLRYSYGKSYLWLDSRLPLRHCIGRSARSWNKRHRICRKKRTIWI